MPSIQEGRVFCYMTDTLSQEEISILKYVDYNVYISRAKAFQLFSTTSDYSIDQLLKCDFLQPIPNESSCFSLTPAGQSFINNYKILEKKHEEEMQTLRKESRFSKRISILSLFVSILSVIVQIILH